MRECGSLQCRLHCAAGFSQCEAHRTLEHPLPERLGVMLEQLGPTFVKLGQMLALRPDYLPLPYAHALMRLHAHVQPFDGAVAEKIVETELRKPLTTLFADFEHEPFASASLSQVHRATLPDGRVVAVKVQRPEVAELIARDLALLRWMARKFDAHVSRSIGFIPSNAVDELATYTTRELDFRREAAVSEEIRRNSTSDQQVVVPAVHRLLSTERVLVTDFIDGMEPAPEADLARAGINPDEVLNAGARWMIRQFFTDGVFHADPHPGNILFLPGNRLCLLDFGMFGRLDYRQRRRMGLMLLALVSGDFNAVGTQLLRVCTMRPGADPRGFRDGVAEIVEEWYRGDSGMTAAQLLLRDLALGASYGIVFPRDLMLLCRAMVTLESTVRIVRPELELAALLRPVLPELRNALLPSPSSLRSMWREERIDFLGLALDLPDMLLEAADKLGQGSLLDQVPAAPRRKSSRGWISVAAGIGAASVITRALR
ncbi:MAG: hypothetical protein LLG14_19355 [Nocardiaceae bacterium]|nr:hypothetical protein [Nocardiaceae bacterium]